MPPYKLSVSMRGFYEFLRIHLTQYRKYLEILTNVTRVLIISYIMVFPEIITSERLPDIQFRV